MLRPWFAQRSFDEIAALLDAAKVLWSPYLDMAEAAARARASSGGMATILDQPGIGPMLSTGSPLAWEGQRSGAAPAPRLGGDTERVLMDVLGLDSATVGRLADDGIVRLH